MAIFFYFHHKFAKFIRQDLADASVAFKLLTKQNQMNCQGKTSQNQLLPILSQTQEQRLEKICQKLSTWKPFPSWSFATRHTGQLFLRFHRYSSR